MNGKKAKLIRSLVSRYNGNAEQKANFAKWLKKNFDTKAMKG